MRSLLYTILVTLLYLQPSYPQTNTKPLTPTIHDAVQIQDIADIERHLAKGVSINEKDRYQDTPLHDAAHGTSVEVVKFLLSKGADVHARDSFGRTPLFDAVRGSTEVLSVLIENGADVNFDPEIVQVFHENLALVRQKRTDLFALY